MAEMLSAGVYLYEKDYSQYVSNASTCIVGCVGEAKRGPIGVPTLVTSQEDLIDMFGTPTLGEYGIYGALQILSQASQVYYVRVVRSAECAVAGVEGTDKIIYKAISAGKESNGIQIEQIVNLDINGDVDTIDVEIKAVDGSTLETYTGMTMDKDLQSYIVNEINSHSQIVKVEVTDVVTLPTTDTFVLKGGTNSGTYATAGKPGVDKLTFRTTHFDSTLNGGNITVSDPDNYGYFNVTVTDSDDNLVESWTSVTLDKKDDRYVGTVINTGSHRIVVTVDDNPAIKLEGDSLYVSGGDDGIDGISVNDIIGERDGIGLHALDNPELLTIDIMVAPGQTNPNVINAALNICESRGDCMFVADTPYGLSASNVVDWTNGDGAYSDHPAFNSSYGAFYWPWVQVADTYSKKNIWLPPSGFVVAKYAYNDEVAYPWVAPAGLTRGHINGVLGLEKSPTKGERDRLYGNRNIVNPIANFQNEGLVIWGQKTMLRTPTALDRVNVRRLVGYLKRKITEVSRKYTFEQNNSSTWTDWKSVVNPILTNVKASNGLYEYKIAMNPTADDIENNRMPANIYIKPTKSAEFIPITFNIMAYDATFEN